METFETISQRRSIRRYKEGEISREDMEKILQAGILAPSAKNKQPWKFVVVTEKERESMLAAMREGLENERAGNGLFSGNEPLIKGAEYTMLSMVYAPVTVFIINTEYVDLWKEETFGGRMADMTNIQSIGAAIENMILAATELGIGSLWICDVFMAYRELCKWLGIEGGIVAAVTFGYAGENPGPRPRKDFDTVVEWR